MDLISREAAIEALGEEPLRWNNTITEGQEWNDWKYHVNAIKSVPSITAVPLDKLCVWLAGYAEPPLDALTMCDNPFEAWKMTLTELMEGQDAAD